MELENLHFASLLRDVREVGEAVPLGDLAAEVRSAALDRDKSPWRSVVLQVFSDRRASALTNVLRDYLSQASLVAVGGTFSEALLSRLVVDPPRALRARGAVAESETWHLLGCFVVSDQAYELVVARAELSLKPDGWHLSRLDVEDAENVAPEGRNDGAISVLERVAANATKPSSSYTAIILSNPLAADEAERVGAVATVRGFKAVLYSPSDDDPRLRKLISMAGEAEELVVALPEAEWKLVRGTLDDLIGRRQGRSRRKSTDTTRTLRERLDASVANGLVDGDLPGALCARWGLDIPASVVVAAHSGVTPSLLDGAAVGRLQRLRDSLGGRLKIVIAGGGEKQVKQGHEIEARIRRAWGIDEVDVVVVQGHAKDTASTRAAVVGEAEGAAAVVFLSTLGWGTDEKKMARKALRARGRPILDCRTVNQSAVIEVLMTWARGLDLS